MNVLIVINLLLSLILVNLDFALLVVINIMKTGPFLYILSFLNILIDMSFGPSLKN